MIIKPKNTERIRRLNLQTNEINLLGQNGGRIYLSVSEQINKVVYVIDNESFFKHFVFASSIDDLPFYETGKFRNSDIQIVKI